MRSWKGLTEALQRKGLPLISLDLTPPRAALGGAPLQVVRAIVPGLIPLSFGYGTEPLGSPQVEALVGAARTPLLPHPLA